jgi:glycosyltransferase involved in cell wall biosynthesis
MIVEANRPRTGPLSDEAAELELSIVMPCLNEAETLAACVTKAQRSLREHGIAGEVIVADNGSTDGSQAIATDLGARVVAVAEKGYGHALQAGIAAARGRYVIMGDSDDSYDFSALLPFVEKLRQGHDLVMGNRFRGGIMPGAMPRLHKLGNPALTSIGRLFFGCPVGDLYCGLRGFSKQAYNRMDLHAPGMEFAYEMVIKSTLLGLNITEVPTVLHKDGRSRPPHLRTWRDGWRTLRFMLLFSPLWLFLLPGTGLVLLGLVASLALLSGPLWMGHVGFSIHSLLVAGFVCLLGYQLIIFGLFTKGYAVAQGLHPPHRFLSKLCRLANLERGVLAGLGVGMIGLVMLVGVVWRWAEVSFGELDPYVTMRRVIPAVVLMMLGAQTVFASFFLSILGLRSGRRGAQ